MQQNGTGLLAWLSQLMVKFYLVMIIWLVISMFRLF